MDELSKAVLEFALLEGAGASGVTTEALADGPPSADLTYVLAQAKSAVSFAIPIAPESIAPYSMKKGRIFLEKEMIRANVLASGVALHLSHYLENSGYKSVPVAANLVYRPDENQILLITPRRRLSGYRPLSADLRSRPARAQTPLSIVQ
ncbi:MAG: hypothetical protein RNU03_00080 [Candidatus Sedimenticola sp. (ex Thyasira tokunagai)]